MSELKLFKRCSVRIDEGIDQVKDGPLVACVTLVDIDFNGELRQVWQNDIGGPIWKYGVQIRLN